MFNFASLSVEVIAHQKDEIFKELTRLIEDIRVYARAKYLKPKSIFTSAPAKELLKFIADEKSGFGLMLSFDPEEAHMGPAIYMPRITQDHIFHDDDFRDMCKKWKYDLSGDSKEIFKYLKTPVFKGEVDIVGAKLRGMFAKIPCVLLIPEQELTGNGAVLSSAQLAAVLLHEIGHAFTYFIMLTRVIRTNQVLDIISRAGQIEDTAKYELIIAQTAEAAGITPENREIITRQKGKIVLQSAIILDNERQNCENELGADVYHSTSCEQLADLFATRCGAGLELVTALEAYNKFYRNASFYIINAAAIALMLWVTVITFGIVWIIIIFCADNRYTIYDDDYNRYRRIRAQIIEELKTQKLTADEIRERVSKIDKIAELMKGKSGNLGIIDSMCYFLNRRFRNQRDAEVLQKNLEKMASNDIFVEAALLSTLGK